MLSGFENGASLAPHEINILFAVFPVATCQGLSNHFYRLFDVFPSPFL